MADQKKTHQCSTCKRVFERKGNFDRHTQQRVCKTKQISDTSQTNSVSVTKIHLIRLPQTICNTSSCNQAQKTAVTFANTDQIILEKDEQTAIIDKFPEKLRPFLANVNNPLDETQILVNLFKDKGVRIILQEEENEFGDFEYVGYFHAEDIAMNIKYDPKHIYQWKTRWKITFASYKNLLTPKEGIKISNMINDKRTKIDANFLSEQELKKVLLKVNTEEANIFQEWILRQSTLTKTLVKWIIKIKHQQELDKKDQENMQLRKRLESKEVDKNKLIELTANALKLFPKPTRKAGLIYIATSPDYQKKYTYKIGYTKVSEKIRENGMQTSNPDISIVYSINTVDVELSEKFIHEYLKHLNYDKEFFYISSLDKARELVSYAVMFVNDFVKTYDTDTDELQQLYVNAFKHDTTVPSIAIRDRSKSPVGRKQ